MAKPYGTVINIITFLLFIKLPVQKILEITFLGYKF